jgi:nucleoid-associated protein YgaU
MSYIKIFTSTIAVSVALFAGCAHAQNNGKRQVLMPGSLPGMGGIARQEEQKPDVAAPGKIIATPQSDNETVTHEVFRVSLSTMPADEAVAMSKAAMEQATEKAPEIQTSSLISLTGGGQGLVRHLPLKNGKQVKQSKIKPREESKESAAAIDQPPVVSSAAATAPVPALEKEPLLTPVSADIEQLKEATPPVVEEKPAKTTNSEVAPVKQDAEENETSENTKSSVKPEPVVERAGTEPQTKLETKPEPIQENTFLKEKKALLPTEEIKAAKPAPQLTKEERQQSARIKYKEEEERKKRQKQESPKHPARMHTVAPGDTLPSLAEIYYGDKNQWWKIYDANKDKIEKGSLKADQLILIP